MDSRTLDFAAQTLAARQNGVGELIERGIQARPDRAGDHDRVGAVGPVAPDETARGPVEGALELGTHVANLVEAWLPAARLEPPRMLWPAQQP